MNRGVIHGFLIIIIAVIAGLAHKSGGNWLTALWMIIGTNCVLTLIAGLYGLKNPAALAHARKRGRSVPPFISHTTDLMFVVGFIMAGWNPLAYVHAVQIGIEAWIFGEFNGKSGAKQQAD